MIQVGRETFADCQVAYFARLPHSPENRRQFIAYMAVLIQRRAMYVEYVDGIDAQPFQAGFDTGGVLPRGHGPALAIRRLF